MSNAARKGQKLALSQRSPAKAQGTRWAGAGGGTWPENSTHTSFSSRVLNRQGTRSNTGVGRGSGRIVVSIIRF